LLTLSATLPASASASSAIEGVWSFNGGKVAVQPAPGGSFVGTVVAPTKFALCSHPIGETMWTGIVPQPDGSYAGFHRWYFESEPCTPNPTPGPTAWRVLLNASGARFLRVCFSSPGSTAPLIAPSGTSTNVTYACVDSALIGALPSATTGSGETRGFAQSVMLPANQKCLSRRIFRIHFKDPLNDPFKQVVVALRNRRLAISRHGRVFASVVSLKGLPAGRFTVNISATTVLGHRIAGSRTYRTCVPGSHSDRSRRTRHPSK
jgi:hypothetical protein